VLISNSESSIFFAVESDNRAPDLNITLSPGLVAFVGDEINITCTAGKPRYKFTTFIQDPPHQVSAIFNETSSKTENCDRSKGNCVQTMSIKLTKAENNVAVSCHSRNGGGDCRLKTLFLTILERRIGTYKLYCQKI
jgi:hypothetical protein